MAPDDGELIGPNRAGGRSPAPIVDMLETTATLRVLVAEDNDFNSELLRQLLASRGHDVRIVSTGREALLALAAEAYDLLLLDIHMPELEDSR